MPIRLSGLHHTYEPGTPWARPVLRGVDLEARPGECLGVIGPIGSGKTTLVQHLNGLLPPQRGEVRVGERVLRPGAKPSGPLFREVAVVFQFPERQLFGETLAEDVAAGPEFAGVPAPEAAERACAALARVGLEPGRYAARPPYTLNWGEKRMAALAGALVLAAPRLVLDEPGAGLDPLARRRLLALIQDLVRREGKTVVFVSHHLDDLFRVADRIAVLHEGRTAFCGSLSELCAAGPIEKWGLAWPPLVRLMRAVAACRPGVRTDVRTPHEAFEVLR